MVNTYVRFEFLTSTNNYFIFLFKITIFITQCEQSYYPTYILQGKTGSSFVNRTRNFDV